jgi:hypothetical protein
MKRARGNGGARDVLRKEQIAVLSGAYDSNLLAAIGISHVQRDELIAVSPLSPSEADMLRSKNVIDG